MSNFKTDFRTSNWESWLHKIKKVSDDIGIRFTQGHSHFFDYSDKELENKDFHIEMLRRSIEGAHILGIKNLVIHACTDFKASKLVEESKYKTIDFLNPYIKLAGSLGICICFENLWDLNISPHRRYCVNAEELVDLVDSLSKSHENIGICWDIEHSGLLKQNLNKELSLVGDRLKAIHVSDYTSIVNDHLLPFEGFIDWHDVMHTLKKVDYKGDFTYEIHSFTMNTPDELVADKLKYSVRVGEYLIDIFNNYEVKHG